MLTSLASQASVLAKRVADGNPEGRPDAPAWAWLLFILTWVAFLPAFFLVSYTLQQLYPVLAMVEDPHPPAYEPLTTSEDVDGAAHSEPIVPPATTASLRRTNRLLYSIGGWRSSFRGLGCFLVIALATGFVTSIFSAIPFVPAVIGVLLSSLALVQLSTAWVHIAVSVPSPLPFWKRLPAFRRTFEATCLPVFVSWLAGTATGLFIWLASHVIGLQWIDDGDDNMAFPTPGTSFYWKAPIIVLSAIIFQAIVVIPAQTVLVRVQASLLPPDADTIVPLDRSFGGVVEPAIVSGKGYASWMAAFNTFPRASWIRLYVLYIKIALINLAAYTAFVLVFVLEVVLVANNAHSRPRK